MMINFLIIFFSLQAFALEVDSKFVGRILGNSDTKRTLLVNRGDETGVKVGDHAKISLPTSGMLARAICVRTSPSRSVWSIYRFFDLEKINKGSVYTFKVAKSVKLTNDESKNLGGLARKARKKHEKTSFEKSGLIQKAKGYTGDKDLSEYQSLDVEEPVEKSKSVDWSRLES